MLIFLKNRKILKYSKFRWINIHSQIPNIQVIQTSISPSDIYQGRLGDCYFLSSISALAEYPARIERLLLTKESRPRIRAYSVALHHCGDWKKLTLDSFFPTLKNRFTFAHTKSAEMWVMLLEKGYAKLYGGYWNIGTGGYPEEALRDLTGAPTEFNLIDQESTDFDRLWSDFVVCHKNRYVMVAGSAGESEKKTPEGIIQGHAYTIIGAHMIRGERVLEMRNPWGDANEWNGRWSDLDEAWDDDLRVEFDMTDPGPDGRFFMPFEAFTRFFDQYSICYYEDEYILSSFQDELESRYLACYRFRAKAAGNYYVCLSQEDRRKFKNQDSEYFSIFWVLPTFLTFLKISSTVVTAFWFALRREMRSGMKEALRTL